MTTTFTAGYSAKALSRAAGSIFQVSLSASMNIGSPPSYITALAVAEKVMSLTSTLSPRFTPASFTARCSAAVPEQRATA